MIPKKPHITTNFDCSTGHITKKDDELIKKSRKDPEHPLIVYFYKEGYFIFCYYEDHTDMKEKIEELEKYGFSKEFIHIFSVSRNLFCKYLQLDCDGTTYEELPTFNW